MEMKNELSWRIAGKAGDGILNTGLMFAKAAQGAGLNVFTCSEYPSLIRGGHNFLDIFIADREVHSQSKLLDILVALNEEAIKKHKDKMNKDGGIIYDGDRIKMDENFGSVKMVAVPLEKIATDAGGAIYKNTVAMGATLAMVNLSLESLNNVIKETFKGKGEAVIEGNIKAAKEGYDYVKKNFPGEFSVMLPKGTNNNTIFMDGNTAIAVGAIKAGCKFYSAYPMTPATSVLHAMAKNERDFRMVVKHTEDELAAVNMAVGASIAGARSMTGTSGGGFALMSEGFGLAAMVETPLVVVEAQRPGPASGMATHTSQADLRFVLHTSTDEAPRFVIAPGDIEDCFYYTYQIFQLSEKYQMPAIIMTDKYLASSSRTAKEFNHKELRNKRYSMLSDEEAEKDGHSRYKVTESGVSPRTIPGQKGGEHIACSYEHDEYGFEREEEENRIEQHDKRFRKMDHALKEIKDPELVGSNDADVTLVAWGSTKGPVLEAMKILERKGIKANFLHIVFISPLPEGKIIEVLNKAKKKVIVEGNKTGMLADLIKEKTCMLFDRRILKYDGRPFHPEDIVLEVEKLLGGGK